MAPRRTVVRRPTRHRALVLLVLAALPACGGGTQSSTSESSSDSRTTTTGAPSVGVEIGGEAVSTVGLTPFDSFTPVPQSGWGADLAATTFPYRPDPNGFAFPNGAPSEPYGVDDAIAMFGAAAVCEEPSGGCTPTAVAQAWVDKVAAATAGGVCEGMVLLSLDRFVADAQPASMELLADGEVTDRVVRLFATQFLPDVLDAAGRTRGRPLRDVLADVESGLRPGANPYTLGIYSAGAGHTLLPYAVRQITETQTAVYVYDPNWPGLDRFIEFDLRTDTWRYSFGAADAANDPTPWFGDGSQMDVVALDAREAPFEEPFAGAGNGAGVTLLTVTTTGPRWSVTNGNSTVTEGTALPGTGSVVSVTRGAFGSTTVVLRTTGPVTVESDGAIDAMVENDQGAVSGIGTGGGRFVFNDSEGLGVRRESGAGELRAYALSGVVVAEGDAGTELAIAGDREVRYGDGRGSDTAVLFPGDGRHDYRIAAGGKAVEVPVPAAPAEVRAAEGRPMLDSSGGDAKPDSTSTPTTSVVSATTAPSPPSSSTSTPNPPPNTSNRVDVIVNFGTVAAGVVTVQVVPKNGYTGSFTVGVNGPQWSSVDGPTGNYSRTFQGLIVNGYYVITVAFSDNLSLTRNFVVP